MKKLFGEDGIKGFLAHHCEKLLLGVAMLVGLYLIASGWSNRTGIADNYDPASLARQVKEAETKIASYSKDDFEERWEKQNFRERADAAQKQIVKASYTMKLLKPPITRQRTMRLDPVIYPATNLIARSGYGSVSLVPPRRNAKDKDGEPDVIDEVDPNEARQLREGERTIPSGFSGSAASNRSGYGDAGAAGGETVGKFFVVVTGLVPYRQQLESYLTSLADSSGYDPQRDMPYYDNWFLERTQVIDGKEVKWTRIAHKNSALRNLENYARSSGSADPTPARYQDRTLTLPLVPIGLPKEEYEQLMRHDAIPSQEQEMEALAAEENPEEEVDTSEDASIFGGGSTAGAAGDRGGYGDEGYGGGSNFASSRGGYGDEGYGGDGGGGGYGAEGYGGEGGAGVAVGQRPDPIDFPEFKMFRYIDFNVTAGASYKYRVKLWIEDPNDPDLRGGKIPPPASALDPVVKTRLTAKAPLNDAMIQAGIKSRYWLETPVSEASTVAKVGTGRTLLAGVVEPVELKGGLPKPGEEASATIMALQFLENGIRSSRGETLFKGRTVPAKLKVRRGSAVNLTMDVEVPIWEQGKLVKQEDQKLQFNAAVVDLQGGTPLGIGGLTAPSDILVFQDGRLAVLNEFDNPEELARYDFPPEESEFSEEEAGGRLGEGRDGGRARGGRSRGGRSRGGRSRGGRGGEGYGDEGYGDEGGGIYGE